MVVVCSKIGIIGAGISGIAAAKQLSEYNPIVLEATECLGGVWKHCSYKCTKLQSVRCDYEFSDFPWPLRDNESFPSYQEILEYLNSYVTHFDVMKFIKFNSKVVEIKFVGNNNMIHHDATDNHNNNNHNHDDHQSGSVWEVAVLDTQSGSIEVVPFSNADL